MVVAACLQVLFLADSQLDLARTTGLHTELWSTTRLRRFSMLVGRSVKPCLGAAAAAECWLAGWLLA